jgi:ketosteroid isomerase-like protein
MPMMTFNAVPLGPDAPPGAEVELVEAYLSALKRQDRGEAQARLAPEVVMHVHGRSLIAGDHLGTAAVTGTYATLHQRSGGTYQVVSTLAWLRMGPHVHHVTAEQATVEGRQLDFNRTTTYEVQNAQITEIRVYEEDQYAFDEFWG